MLNLMTTCSQPCELSPYVRSALSRSIEDSLQMHPVDRKPDADDSENDIQVQLSPYLFANHNFSLRKL